MDLLLSWVAFPLALAVLCGGCGLAVEALVGARMPGPLVPAVGLAAIVVVGQFLTLSDGTAELTTPVVVLLAAAGLGIALLTRRPLRPPPALFAALAGVLAVYSAPIVLSGEPTLAGFIKLDDTATWLAFTDHVLDGGRDLDALAPSTYETTLAVNVGEGYPIGAFPALGVGSQLLATDPAWLIQPYMAWFAALFALAAWTLAAPLVASSGIRALLVFVASQPALLFGYYLWGGVKEMAAAALIATLAALAASALARSREPRRLAFGALVGAALIGVLGGGGAVWMGPILLAALFVLCRRLPWRAVAARAAGFVVALVVLSLPVIVPGGLVPPTSSSLSDPEARGNLIEALDPLQAVGIWPVGDFRLPVETERLAYPLIALASLLALAGLAWAWRRRAIGLLSLLAGGVAGCTILVLAGSPWVQGKALATISPIVLLGALVGVAALGATGRTGRRAALVAGIAVAGGVLWSNALAYRDVSLAPHDQFAELEELGEGIAGEGPTLMTEYSPFGARHFLREGDAEAVSGLRRRRIPRRNGRLVRKGQSADTDQLDQQALVVYRTLVLRRSPAASRPPGAYELVWRGEFYEAWQRPEGLTGLPPRIGLGSRFDPLATPRCRDVLALARRGEALVAAARPGPIVVPLAATDDPRARAQPGFEQVPAPDGDSAIVADVPIERSGNYEIWLGESVRSAVELVVDGERVREVRHQLNNLGQYVAFGSAPLEPGPHRIELRLEGADLHPGSGGQAPVGPLALSAAEAADSRLVRVDAADARELCGREWDWIESR